MKNENFLSILEKIDEKGYQYIKISRIVYNLLLYFQSKTKYSQSAIIFASLLSADAEDFEKNVELYKKICKEHYKSKKGGKNGEEKREKNGENNFD